MGTGLIVRLLIVIYGLVLYGLSPTHGQTETHTSEKALRASLLSGYDQASRPYSPTTVEVAYFIRSLEALSVADQTFSHTWLLIMSWTDPRLVWNSTTYPDISEMEINWTWRPTFMIPNRVDDPVILGTDNIASQVTVFRNGSVLWYFQLITTTSCDVNIKAFPHDSQTCPVSVVFTGNSYGTRFLLSLTSTEVNTMSYTENGEWRLDSSSLMIGSENFCCPQLTEGVLMASFNYQRMHTFYTNTFLIPTILMSVTLIWPFYLPTDSGERLGFSLTVLLSYTVILTITTEYLPTTSKEIPHLAVYLLVVLVMCTMATCNVALHVKIYFMEAEPTKRVKKIYRKVKPIVFMEFKKRPTKVKVADSMTVEEVDTRKDAFAEKRPPKDPEPAVEEEEEEITYARVSMLMDRICFIMYSLIMIIINIVLFAALYS